ncbi:hypothetical protein [Mariniblastus fucicola]|uniref:hypothetical protein n=1 Tax=Mariniblastus fucicola TaxID=980251 RepID=UPI0012FAFBFD|nr:hypothetical protein [Mariniblastus fucicola]
MKKRLQTKVLQSIPDFDSWVMSSKVKQVVKQVIKVVEAMLSEPGVNHYLTGNAGNFWQSRTIPFFRAELTQFCEVWTANIASKTASSRFAV